VSGLESAGRRVGELFAAGSAGRAASSRACLCRRSLITPPSGFYATTLACRP